ncbi:GNAT family N-acetyltransferase [Candidatus Nitrosacidococcus sp. I8]|uniref:GNAT family N-acetyltransferase n=1 Tax=Candidatus Nitrosacidococcus sp. I8 TaxID=2942908 RepID=UPI002226718E|nr:GNAT family N-acetyltransferase [Candidatus Nitrosacidococcus sp. I8]CAH9018666.1 hypothetical protein NURINAE_01062 [Candidatus Nitrosacidococcus sp. I8]
MPDSNLNLTFIITQSIQSVAANQWNELVGTDNPFLRYEFFIALEVGNCLGSHIGWFPQYLLGKDLEDNLIGAAPLFLKTNSFGEFVFDYPWIEAWEQMVGRYYPKLVVAIPFSPVTGARLLLRSDVRGEVAQSFVQQVIILAKKWGVSSLHWLFPPEQELSSLTQGGYVQRLGYQFHWHNQGYHNFDEFLETLTSKRRKEVRRERKQVQEQGITISIIHGNEVTESHWQAMYQFYLATFEEKGNYPALSLDFFKSLGESMGDSVILMLAKNSQQNWIAGAFYLRSHTTLYGRYWGCMENVPGLHFELCYYQGINYCIDHKIHAFEPGAQGEHKISRGFLPTSTWSAHWFSHPEFQNLVAQFFIKERKAVIQDMAELSKHSPYKQS